MIIIGDDQVICYNDQGLVPAIAQDAHSGAVLMLAWVNAEALQLTIDSGYAHYYSRSRAAIWKKGETSGHLQRVYSIAYDCDGDTLLYTVQQTGAACHTGAYTCFHYPLAQADAPAPPAFALLQQEYQTILERKEHPKEGSYTNYLLTKGVEKICKKVGEEASEVIIAAMKGDNAELRYEIADLLYHLAVLMADRGEDWQGVLTEVRNRMG